jgi:sRNA-binding protein
MQEEDRVSDEKELSNTKEYLRQAVREYASATTRF